MSGNVKIGGDFTKTPNPQWLKDRDEVYKKVKERRAKEIEGKMVRGDGGGKDGETGDRWVGERVGGIEGHCQYTTSTANTLNDCQYAT